MEIIAISRALPFARDVLNSGSIPRGGSTDQRVISPKLANQIEIL
jgi:hypothetical protein